MEFLNAFINWLTNPTWQSEIIIAAAMCLVLYTIFKNRNEFSRHALENTATTLVLAAFNMGVAIFFLKDVNAFAQSSYDALRIPTLDPAIWDSVPPLDCLPLRRCGQGFCRLLEPSFDAH